MRRLVASTWLLLAVAMLAFVWSYGEMTELCTLPDSNDLSCGYAFNKAGVVVGESDNERPRAFRWKGRHHVRSG